MRNLRKPLTGLALAGTLLFGIQTAQAESAYWEVEQQLIEAAITLGIADDFEPISDPLFTELDEDETDNVQINMQGGRDHAIVVVCDNDCDDVDVRLYDSRGRLIDRDEDSDDVAVLHGRPDITETYTVRIDLVDCDSEPCVVGAVLFGR